MKRMTIVDDEDDNDIDDDDHYYFNAKDDEEDDDPISDEAVVLYFSFDTGSINASAEGVNINTALNLIRDDKGRLKINNITCDARIAKMKAAFSGTLG